MIGSIARKTFIYRLASQTTATAEKLAIRIVSGCLVFVHSRTDSKGQVPFGMSKCSELQLREVRVVGSLFDRPFAGEPSDGKYPGS